MSPPIPRIRVLIDDTPITLWSWARVRHALNWYSEEAYRDVLAGHKVVCDEGGHPVDPDGALEDGARLHLEDARRPHHEDLEQLHHDDPRQAEPDRPRHGPPKNPK